MELSPLESCARALLLTVGPRRAAAVMLELFPGSRVSGAIRALMDPELPEILRGYASQAEVWLLAMCGHASGAPAETSTPEA